MLVVAISASDEDEGRVLDPSPTGKVVGSISAPNVRSVAGERRVTGTSKEVVDM